MNNRGIISKYRHYLPVTGKTPIVSLQEGNTPLIPASSLAQMANARGISVYLKYEGANPTGSFKDRGMTLAISKAKEAGSKAVICASTGNTSASAAAYAARAGIKCFVVLPKGAIALGKLAQAMMHGAKVIAIEGNFDQALEIVKVISSKYNVTLVNSINPYRIEGQKTGAFEIVDALGGRCPDFHFIPVGNAGNITAYWKGYKEYKRAGRILRLPRMMGWQAAMSAPIVIGKPVKNPKTIATAIKIGNPASWKSAVEARDESQGMIGTVTDKEILAAYRHLAQVEGVFCEPASAASVAGFIKLAAAKFFKQQSSLETVVVCILTGHGLKDPDRALSESVKFKTCKPAVPAVMKLMGLDGKPASRKRGS
ncbi:threonine synthase [candidate division FCPU426 bacterium]|nr:threonine synthase [candidate division FCPU426 bacterium]